MLSRKDLVTALADTITTDFFLKMLNPDCRGSHFRFGLFNIEGWVRERLGRSMGSPPPTVKELGQAGSRARKKWAQLIEQIGNGIPKSNR